ncbi:conserved hypothetical protein [delta proteobacterium NaphS2]|nr:conserved hypothetical protein [delta proteobacterium NaphS2]
MPGLNGRPSLFSKPSRIPGISRYTYEPIGVAIQKNDILLANWLENFLDTLAGSGELKELQDKWFEGGDWIEKLP